MSARGGVLLGVGVVTAALILGCGNGKAPSTRAVVGGPTQVPSSGPDLDCDALVDRITTCAVPFEQAYARTEDAGNRGKQTVGGPPDGEAGAKTFMLGFRGDHNRVVGMDLCTKDWRTRDPRWRVRLSHCDAHADCATWAPCVAEALGEPLPDVE